MGGSPMPTTLRRLNARLYVWRRSLLRYKVTVMGLLLTCFGAATALGNPHVVISVAAATAGIVVSTLEVYSNRRRSKTVRFQRRKADDYRDLLRDAQADGRVIRTPSDVGILMVEETSLIRRKDVPASMDEVPFVVHSDLERYSIIFLARRLRRSVLFNGRALGLSSDIPRSGDRPVALRPVRYFDFVATNLLSPNDVYEVGRQEPVLRGRDLIFNSRGEMRRFQNSRLANTVGVSTLAFTKDGKLLLVCQTVDVAGSPGLIAPSGSGALEPRDMSGAVSSTLQEIVLAGAHRELREECNIVESDIEEGAEVIGFGRWVSRGAMPEFCAVTLLTKSADEILKKRVRRGERIYVGDVMAVRLPAIDDWSAITGLELLGDKAHRHAVSWPLGLALTCLVQVMRDPSWQLRKRLLERLDSDSPTRSVGVGGRDQDGTSAHPDSRPSPGA